MRPDSRFKGLAKVEPAHNTQRHEVLTPVHEAIKKQFNWREDALTQMTFNGR